MIFCHKTPVQIPKTQYSTIPTFQYSPATAGLGVNPCFKNPFIFPACGGIEIPRRLIRAHETSRVPYPTRGLQRCQWIHNSSSHKMGSDHAIIPAKLRLKPTSWWS
jgi:hypothetical protein